MHIGVGPMTQMARFFCSNLVLCPVLALSLFFLISPILWSGALPRLQNNATLSLFTV